MTNLIKLSAFLVVFWRVVAVCADASPTYIRAHWARAGGMGVALATMIAASIGVVTGFANAGDALLIALALLVIFDRRRRFSP
jgi:hypothetical protein